MAAFDTGGAEKSVSNNEEQEQAEKVKATGFQTTLEQHVYGGFLTLGLALGSQLGLVDKMIELNEPASSGMLAEEINCRPQYVEELLRMLACGDIVDFTESDGQILYHIPKYKQASLRGSIMGCFQVPRLAAPYSKLLECFQNNGPLDNGAYCLDIGCGSGEFFQQLAPEYPNSAFLGVDISKSLIVNAKEESKDIHNLSFEVENATSFPEDWTGKFNIVFTIETLHDLSVPNKTLGECFRILAPDGVLSVVDVNIKSSLAGQKKTAFGSVSGYTYSLYHCLSTAQNVDGANGMGVCAGYEKMKAVIESEGFSNVQMKDIPDNGSCIHFVARKSAQ